MKHINTYINEAWSGVKKQISIVDVEAWCEEMGIKKYNVNSNGEIDVNGYVGVSFFCNGCKSLNSLEGCPKEVGRIFACGSCKRNFTEEEVKSLCKVKGNIDLK